MRYGLGFSGPAMPYTSVTMGMAGSNPTSAATRRQRLRLTVPWGVHTP